MQLVLFDMEMNKNCITIFKRESPTKKMMHFDARKHWKRLQRAVLSDRGTMPRENDATVRELKAEQQDIIKKKGQLKAMFEKSIQDAKKALAKAELKSEHTSTSHKKEVTNLKRKMIISEHSKIIEKVFEEGRQDANRTKSTEQMANSLRLIRKVEAQHDRLRARKLRLKKMAREKLKVKKRDERVDEGSMMQMDGDEMQWWRNSKNKLRQQIGKEDEETQDNSLLNNPERGYKNIEESTVDTNDEEYTKSKSILMENDDVDINSSSRNVKERQRYNRIANGKGILPSVFETEVDDSEVKDEADAEIMHIDKLQMYGRESTRPNVSRKNDSTLPLLKRIPKKLSDNRMEFITAAEYDLGHNIPHVNNRYKDSTLESLYKEDAEDFNEFHQKQMKKSIKSNTHVHLKSKTEGTSLPQLVKKPGNTKSSFDDFIKRDSNNVMKRLNETTMQASSEKIPEKIGQSIMQYRYRDTSFCESTWSSLTLNSSLEWASSRNHQRSVDDIYKTLCDVGLNINAAALEYSLRTIIEEQQVLQEKLQEVKDALAKEKERKKLEEKEILKIKKMKKAYYRYKKQEKERREREELKRKLQEEAQRRIEKHRKLYKEMMLLAMENNLSRNYNFSYFMGMKPPIEDKSG